MTTEKIEKNDFLEKNNTGNSIKTISKIPFEKTEHSDVINIAMDFEEKLEKQILHISTSRVSNNICQIRGDEYCSLHQKS